MHTGHSQEFFLLFETPTNDYPIFPILNFPLQQFSFCLFQKKDKIKFTGLFTLENLYYKI